MIDFSIFKRWQVWLTIVISLVVILGITRVLTGSGGFPNAFPSALVAWGTLMLSIATITIVISSRAQESQRRTDEHVKEIRDRDTSLLNEIIDWAIEVLAIGMPPKAGTFIVGAVTEEIDRRLILDSLNILKNSFRAMIAKSFYIDRIGLAFGQELQKSIVKLEGDLRKQADILDTCVNNVLKRMNKEFNESCDELVNNWRTVGDSAVNVIDQAVIEKLTILNIDLNM